MTPQGLTRLRIADLVVEIPGDLELPDAGILEEHLRPFAWEGEGEAEVVVEGACRTRVGVSLRVVGEPRSAGRLRSGRPGASAPASPNRSCSFQVDLMRFIGRPGGEERSVLPYRCTEEPSRLRVAGPLPDTMAVVSAVHMGLAHRLPARGGLLLHASAVRTAGWAFVFPGPAETGKSTAAKG
jgi:hypothetical protein